MIKVSICIPAFNNEQAVERLLTSIENQTFRDYEVIITDDSTGSGVAELAAGRSYIRYYRNVQRLGAAANWNEAIGKSRGKYIKIMHHDDWFTEKDSLQAFVDMLENHPEADMAFSGTVQAEAQDSYERCISEADAAFIKEDYRNLYLGNTIGAPSAVIVRRKISDSPEDTVWPEYDKELKWLVDMEYYMGILQNNPRFVYTERPLVSIGVSSGQLTEECRDDKELNVKEYGYIYHKYNLGNKAACREKLTAILAEAGKTKEEAQTYGIESTVYRRVLGEKFVSKIKWKLTHRLNQQFWVCFFLLLFVASLVPIFMLAGINQATGDDLGYGKLTHEAWLASHSLWEVIKAACRTVQNYYIGWQGTWFSIFLFSLQPEVFSPHAYVIVPFMMIGIFAAATAVLSYYVLVKLAGGSKASYVLMVILLCSAGLQFVPSTKSGIFWYNGAAHYVIPYAIALMAIYFFLCFMNEKGKGAYLGLTVCMFLLGGVNYLAALLAPIVIVLLLPVFFRTKSKGRAAACLLPILLEMAGLVISMLSPGNSNRGGEEFGFSAGLAITTILECFVRGIVKIGEYIGENPLLILVFAAAAFCAWDMFARQKNRRRYAYPAVFVIFSYCVYCAMFAPEIYAGVEVSGGVANMNYYVFLLMVFSDIIYVEGWLAYRCSDCGKVRRKAALPFCAAALLLLLVFRGNIKETSMYACIDYMKSGQAEDFKNQMKEQKGILLDSGIKDAVLPAVNDNQGPLMHMPITDKPEAWTNTITREFYGKNSVVAIPREEWNQSRK